MNGIRMPVAKTPTATTGYGTTFRRITFDDLAMVTGQEVADSGTRGSGCVHRAWTPTSL
jgi:hypothetical protein